MAPAAPLLDQLLLQLEGGAVLDPAQPPDRNRPAT